MNAPVICNCDLDFGPTTQSLSLRYFYTERLCEVISAHQKGLTMTKPFFYKTVCELGIEPKILNRKLVQDIVAVNICVKLYRNLSINIGSRRMTKFS